jgi:hypothetical protein
VNEIRGVVGTADSGFLRLTAQAPDKSCIDLIGDNLDLNGGKFSNSVRISTGGVDRMVVNGSGNVGIGTVVPGVRLDVSGAASVAAARIMSTAATGTALITTGRVGVNQATPGVDLDVVGTARVNSGAATSTAITTTGRIGVNQATPGVDLDVVGTARVNSGAATSTALTTTGWVGVNKATPTVALDVAGAASISGILNMNSYRISGLPDSPSSDNDATSKKYVDTKTTDMATNASVATATSGMATTTAVNTAITNALNNGSMVNNPSCDSSISTTDYYITGINSSNFQAGNIRRELMSGTTAPYFRSNRLTAFNLIADNRIGIGNTSPDYPLHVTSVTSKTYAGNWSVQGGSNNQVSVNASRSASIYSAGDIVTGGILIFSDKRIKKNVKDIDGNTALSQIRQIRPKIYNYIDYNTKGNGNVYGFIAQDVKDVILHSTMCTKDYIPNFYCQGNIRSIDTTNYIYEISSENDLSFEKVLDDNGNEVLFHKVKIYGYDNTQYICSVLQVNNPKNIRVKLEKEYKFSNVEEDKYKIFIYGQEINDFHNLEKNAIFTVAIAAIQEVDRQQQADKVRIAELEATVARQQSLINDILERLKTLEKA